MMRVGDLIGKRSKNTYMILNNRPILCCTLKNHSSILRESFSLEEEWKKKLQLPHIQLPELSNKTSINCHDMTHLKMRI